MSNLCGFGRRFPGVWSAWTAARLRRATSPLQRATLADAWTWLPDDLLVKFDRMSMAHSLEGRAPYLAPELFERAMALPSARRRKGATSKVALREVGERWLPREAWAKRKQGFVLPMAGWLRSWFDERGPAKDYFAAREVPGLDIDALAQLAAQDLAAGLQRERFLFAVVVLVEWFHAARETRGRLRDALKSSS